MLLLMSLYSQCRSIAGAPVLAESLAHSPIAIVDEGGTLAALRAIIDAFEPPYVLAHSLMTQARMDDADGLQARHFALVIPTGFPARMCWLADSPAVQLNVTRPA